MSIARLTQTLLHITDDAGKIVQQGNCFQTAVACLLGLALADVPNFVGESEWWESDCREWALERGLMYWRHGMQNEHGSQMGWAAPFYWIASGPTVRGTSHATIYKGSKLEWDPHPSRAGILEIESATFFVPLDIASLLASSRCASCGADDLDADRRCNQCGWSD